MVDEYIKRKDVLECIKESRDGIDWGQSEDGDAFLHYSACLYRTIASNECFPSADAVEVRHGKWIPFLPEYRDMFRCSKCKVIVRLPFKTDQMPYEFCPGCGARMDGE